ncbi:DUF3857 domain-containing protein [Leptolyngbya sp. 'hensonii']|uniref:DUF3857 domain-containing protein n=1 Tax=Leptolyngbya sp. 'hensonii' TaxID=1922337 RepID=UPI0015C55B87|nr:DUF3857 domain-containing protein [Leptolyngbya sp. 'hensonii']
MATSLLTLLLPSITLRSASAADLLQIAPPQTLIAQLTLPLDPRFTIVPNDPRKRPLEDVRYEDYQSHYTLNPDYTYTQIISTRTTLLTPSSLEDWQQESRSYYPDTQDLELVEAYVIQPDGRRIVVTPDNIFTRSGQTSEEAPGFDNSLTTTVVFPKLQVGSQTYVKWKFTQKKPSVVGFHDIDMPDFSYNSRQEVITVTMPANLKLRWAKQGDYVVTDEIKGKQRVLKAVLKNYRGRQPEPGMTSPIDVSPFFLVTNLDRWEDLGAIYWRQSHDKVQVTPEIKVLADRIVGSKTGIEAARAIYNWVTQNIQYTAVYLDEDAGWVPHPVSEILKNGYGDCKDHVALMQALLQAKGMEAVPVLIDLGNQYSIPPLPISQFNHAIIYLPQFQLFADPTDRYAAFGELSQPLRSKFVVLATEKGATAFTPASQPQQNRYLFNGIVTLNPDGTILGQAQIQVVGQESSDTRELLTSDTPEQLADDILAATPEGGYGSLQASDLNNLNQPIQIRANWTSPLAIELGPQIYFPVPEGLNISLPQGFRNYISYSDRLYSLMVGAATMEWNYRIRLPQGYQVGRLPTEVNFQNGAGTYQSRYQWDGEAIVVQRQLILNKDVYPAQEYPEFKALIYKPINDFRSVIVLDRR